MIETTGEQLEGNRDTEYKRALLDTLSDAFRSGPKSATGLALSREPFDFDAAVVLSMRSTPAFLHCSEANRFGKLAGGVE